MALIKKAAARERLGVSMNTLDKLIRDGKIPAYRVGDRGIRIKSEDLDRYLEGCRIPVAEPKDRMRYRKKLRRCEYVPGMKVV